MNRSSTTDGPREVEAGFSLQELAQCIGAVLRSSLAALVAAAGSGQRHGGGRSLFPESLRLGMALEPVGMAEPAPAEGREETSTQPLARFRLSQGGKTTTTAWFHWRLEQPGAVSVELATADGRGSNLDT